MERQAGPADRTFVYLTHQIPGRARLKVPARRRDRRFFDEVAKGFSSCPGVSAVEADPRTASLLVRHTSPWEAIVDSARRSGLLAGPGRPVAPAAPIGSIAVPPESAGTPGVPAAVPEPEPPAPWAGRQVPDRQGPGRPAGRPAGQMDLRRPLALLFFVGGVVQLFRGQILLPAIALFWYAFDLWRTANAPAPAEARREAADADYRIEEERGRTAALLGPARSFYFRGPDYRLNLRADTLGRFLELAAGVDDATWMHHLRSGDYSRWLRESIRDDALADEVRRIETDPTLGPAASRSRVRQAFERRQAV